MTAEWQERELDELFSFSSGKPIAPGGDGAFPAFGSNGLIGRSERSLFEAGIIIGRVGAYCGSTAISFSPFWASDNTIVALPKNEVDLRFGYYLLSNARLNRHAGGAAQPLLTQSTIKPLRFKVPSQAAQRRIAAILGRYDDLIEVNRRRVAVLDEMAGRLFDEWFVHLRFPGHESVPMVKTPEGILPRDWEWKPVREVLAHAIGGTWGEETADAINSEQCTVIRGTDFPRIRRGKFDELPRRFVSTQTLKSRLLQPNDIVLEVSGGSKDQPVGRAIIAAAPLLDAIVGPCTVASFCRLMRVDPTQGSHYHLFWHLDRMYRTGTIEAYQTQSTGLRNFKFTVFIEKEQLCSPPKELLTKFDQLMSPVMNGLATLYREISALRQCRDLLLPRLISGELPVGDAERELESAA